MIYLADPKYNPEFQSTISSKTELGPGITMAKFLGSPGTRVQLDQVQVDHRQLARNLYLHAELLRLTSQNPDFSEHRVIVAEGVYVPAPKEKVTDKSVNFYKQTGEAVVYQVINRKGVIDYAKTFDLAVYWKDYANYNELILDYDSYDPSGQLCAQIVVIFPTVPSNYVISFSKSIQTIYNGQVQSRNELIEILPF